MDGNRDDNQNDLKNIETLEEFPNNRFIEDTKELMPVLNFDFSEYYDNKNTKA